MDKRNILKLENGTLYLKLQEDFDQDTLEVFSVVAKITRDGATITNPDTTNLLRLTRNAIKLLAEGADMVKVYWSIGTLPRKHVLLACGCDIDWDDYCSEDPSEIDDDLPVEGDYAYCKEHEETLIVRFNSIDFQ